MPKLPRLSDYEITVQREFHPGDMEFTYFLKIPFEQIAELKISVANRSLVNLSSGLVRHLTKENGEIFDADGVKIIDGRLITDSLEKRIFHWQYDTHMEKLGIKDSNGNALVPAYLNGWRDLGQNPWHVLWERDPAGKENYLTLDGNVANEKRQQDRLVRLEEDDKYGITRNGDLNTGRVYTCLVVPKQGNPYITELRFDEKHDVYDSRLEHILSDRIEWTASGKPIVKDGNPLSMKRDAPFSIYNIIEQLYDQPHVFPVSKESPEYVDGVSDRRRTHKTELLQSNYGGYPEKFKENCQKSLDQDLGTAKYYFDIVGVNDNSLMIFHKYGTLAEVSEAGVQKGMKNAIIVDEGGSVATWSWYHGPNGGFENCSSYLRPSAIAVLGIKLKELKEDK